MEDLDDVEDLEFEKALYDIFDTHESVGDIVVAKKGDNLPLTTGQKRKEKSAVPVKFEVSKTLNVTVIERTSKNLTVQDLSV